MYTRRLFTLILLLLFGSGIIVQAGADNLGGYIVMPVRPGMDTGSPLETREAGFWELPFHVILLSLALCISPVLEYAVQLLFLTRIYLYLGYRKIADANLLSNQTRDQVYLCIRENPGISFTSIIQKTGVKPGTLRYHLLLLQSINKITALSDDGHARYFENSGVYSECEKIILKYIRNETDNRILRQLIDDPELNRRELGKKIGKSELMVTWYMKRLAGAGIITIRKSGKEARYEINPDMLDYLEKYLHPETDSVPRLISDAVPESG